MESRRPREVRKFVERQFAEIEPEANQIQDETLLIRNGQYCGHRYRSERISAVWFLEENQVKVYDHSGRLLRVVSPLEFDPQLESEAA